MANWCTNMIKIRGMAKDLKAFDKHFQKKHLSFKGGTSFIPLNKPIDVQKEWIDYKLIQPDVCHYISEMKEVEGYSFMNFVPMTKEDWLNNWYDWCNHHWGTKWDLNPNNMDITNLDLIEETLKNGSPDKLLDLYYNFDTAWIPCQPVVEEMAKQFPHLNFTYEYYEEGNLIAGSVEYENGEAVHELVFEGEEPHEYYEFMANELNFDGYEQCQNCYRYAPDYMVNENEICEDCEQGGASHE